MSSAAALSPALVDLITLIALWRPVGIDLHLDDHRAGAGDADRRRALLQELGRDEFVCVLGGRRQGGNQASRRAAAHRRRRRKIVSSIPRLDVYVGVWTITSLYRQAGRR